MIEGVLSERALCSVESREDVVEVQVIPGTRIERVPGPHVGQPGPVGLGNCLHLSVAIDRLPPCRTDLCQSPCSAAPYDQSSETQEGNESDEDQPGHTKRSL